MSALLEQQFNSSGRRNMLKELVQPVVYQKVQLYLLKPVGNCPNYGTRIDYKLTGMPSQQQASKEYFTALT